MQLDAIFYPCLTYNFDEGLGDNHYNCPVVAYYPEVLTSWALEGSVVTADSMRSRGYGSGKRSSFMIYTMTGLDWGLLAAQAVLLVGMIVLGDRTAAFTPVLNIAPIGGRNLPGFLCYLCYLLIPIALHIKEAIQWRISISKI